eukprot:12349653-Heterocapsa_arctica.AAC.1
MSPMGRGREWVAAAMVLDCGGQQFVHGGGRTARASSAQPPPSLAARAGSLSSLIKSMSGMGW